VSKWVNVVTQTIGSTATNGTGWSFVDFTITSHTVSGWYVIRYIAKFPSGATSPRTRIDPVDNNNSNSKTTTSGAKLTLWHPQSTNVTWMDTPANAADEYVSVGVLSSPWHGAGADGVKYFSTYEDGAPIPEANLLGARLNPNAVTNNLLYCRDLTNAAWTKTNVTAALTQTGLDGQSNACSLLTATATDGTVLQTITAAAAAACSGFYVKRSSGTGSIYFTRDGGANWTDITSLINSTDFSLVKIENTSVLNPQVGFKIAASGDAIIVDFGINHLGTQISDPIETTSTAVTVNGEVLTIPTTGNFSDAAGTILATVDKSDWSGANGSVVGSATRGLYTSASNSGAQGLDGTNTVNGPAGTPSGTVKTGIRWSGSSLQAFSNGSFGTAGSYDGAFNLTSVAAMAGAKGAVKDIAIWPSSLSDSDMISASESIVFNLVNGSAAALSLAAQSGLVIEGRTIDASIAALSFAAQDGLEIIGRTIDAGIAPLTLSMFDGEVIIGRTIDADVAALSLFSPDGLEIIGRTIDGDIASLAVVAQSGAVLLDDSPRSAVTITATLASPTITARL